MTTPTEDAIAEREAASRERYAQRYPDKAMEREHKAAAEAAAEADKKPAKASKPAKA